MCGVNEYHPSYFIRVKAPINPRVQTAEGRTSEHVGRRHACSFQELMKILSNCVAGSRKGTGIAPTLAGSVVPAGLCELGDFRLKRLPFEAGAGSARLEDHWRRTCSRAKDIETTATNVHRPSDLWKA